MEPIQAAIQQAFGHKLRLRVSGICLQNDCILLVKHLSLGPKGILWAPPGGGLDYHETIHECLQREFLEETGLQVAVHELLFVNEYFEHPLHAIELFFRVEQIGGTLCQGSDPEMQADTQIIHDVAFVSLDEIRTSDPAIYHSLFKTYPTTEHFVVSAGFHQNIVHRP